MSSQIDSLRQDIMRRAQGAVSLNIAFIGVANGLFAALDRLTHASVPELAQDTGMDSGYVDRWCDAAYAFEYLEEIEPGVFRLSDSGRAFLPDSPGTLMPFAVMSVLSAHMAERAAGLMRTGERPGESVLAERETILPWFGPMLEYQFGPLLDKQVLDQVPVFREVDSRGGLAVDLGCGNGWYLRRLARRYPHLRGIGMDGFEENVNQATRMAEAEGLSDRLTFAVGDLNRFHIEEPVDLIAMNRALHHVWDQKENVFRILREHLKPGGAAVIWEPNWPANRSDLRSPDRRAMAFQNLTEHVQGNHFLRPEEIADQFRAVGLKPEVYFVADGRDAVVTGTLVD
ncbi:methyltransferase type 11 [Acidihalobacter aeolianus]|uniref:Methyltransferase type 11 n=1 Tax=Acidihalobacter aeolianus TaxID=2792603 RepID=A0A1D8K6L8_9GAMM|nr:class I SAM-dependent methyltransferase [Acidihalobacter aeolianus]AOV16598.1 methyltransferase type 11 [Acidihalobacter aeolianus]